jgi:glycine cleavage system aminomethyltransferase T
VNGPVRRSPQSRLHERLGAVLEHAAAWELIDSYGDQAAERGFMRDAAAITDITPRGKIDIRGDMGAALGAAGDALVAVVAPDWAMVFTEPGGEEILLGKLELAAGPSAMVTDATHLFAGFALSGPKLSDVLERTTGWDPATLAPGAALGAPIVEVGSIMVRRDLPVPVVEIYVAQELGRYVWRSLLDVVQEVGGAPAGWGALRAEGWR